MLLLEDSLGVLVLSKNRIERVVLLAAALSLVLVVLANSALVLAGEVSGEVSFNIRGTGEGYVIVDGDAQLEGAGEFNGSCNIVFTLETDVEDSKVMKLHSEYLINLTAPKMFPASTSATSSSFSSTQPTLESLVMTVRGGHEAIAGSITQDVSIIGYLTLSNNKSIEFDVKIITEGTVNESATRVNATVNIEEGALSEKDVSNLKFMTIFMTPEMLNSQLEQMNITWIHINNISVEFNEVDGGGILAVTAELLTEKPPANLTISGAGTEVTEALTALSKEISELNSSSDFQLVVNIARAKDDYGIFYSEGYVNYVVEGDLEKLAVLLHDFFVKSAKPESGSGIDELVIMPSDASANLQVLCEEGGARLKFSFKGLKIRHSELTGPEAESRISSIIVSIIEMFKQGLKPTVKVSTNIEGVSNVSVDPVVMRSLAITLQKASAEENIPEPIRGIIPKIELPTTTTPTVTIPTVATTPTPTTTTPTTTSSPTTTPTTTTAPTPTPTTTVPTTTLITTPTPTTTPAPSPGLPTTLIISAVIAVAIIAVVALLLLRKR